MKRLFKKVESPKNDLKPFLELFNRFKPLKKLIKKNSIIFDVGCNVGDTIAEFQHVFKCKKIYGFEPQIDCVEKLNIDKQSQKIGQSEFFSLYKIGSILSCSHGMGLSSVCLFLNELLHIMHISKNNKYELIRLGSSGGIGV